MEMQGNSAALRVCRASGRRRGRGRFAEAPSKVLPGIDHDLAMGGLLKYNNRDGDDYLVERLRLRGSAGCARK